MDVTTDRSRLAAIGPAVLFFSVAGSAGAQTIHQWQNQATLGHMATPAPPPPMANMPIVGQPNILQPDGRPNYDPNASLPNAFNWNPFIPNAAPTTIPNNDPYQIGGSWGYRRHWGDGQVQNSVPDYTIQPTETESSTPSIVINRPTRNPGQIPPLPQATITQQPGNTVISQPSTRAYQHTGNNYDPYDSTLTIIGDNGSTEIISSGVSFPYYCDDSSADAYPSVYSNYPGIPPYIEDVAPGLQVAATPYYPQYAGSYTEFNAPQYQVTNNYYGAAPPSGSGSTDQAPSPSSTETPSTPDSSSEAPPSTFRGASSASQSATDDTQTPAAPVDNASTFQEAFADIEQAWSTSNVELIRKHLRDDNTKVGVLLNRKYAYSISSDDFSRITRDAMKKLDTISFKFTRLRKAKNGDITAYGTHIYAVGSSDEAANDDTVPFDTSKSDASAQTAEGRGGVDSSTPKTAATGGRKVMYVSYTLRKDDDGWIINLVDSSTHKLVPSQTGDDAKSTKVGK